MHTVTHIPAHTQEVGTSEAWLGPETLHFPRKDWEWCSVKAAACRGGCCEGRRENASILCVRTVKFPCDSVRAHAYSHKQLGFFFFFLLTSRNVLDKNLHWVNDSEHLGLVLHSTLSNTQNTCC